MVSNEAHRCKNVKIWMWLQCFTTEWYRYCLLNDVNAEGEFRQQCHQITVSCEFPIKNEGINRQRGLLTAVLRRRESTQPKRHLCMLRSTCKNTCLPARACMCVLVMSWHWAQRCIFFYGQTYRCNCWMRVWFNRVEHRLTVFSLFNFLWVF